MSLRYSHLNWKAIHAAFRKSSLGLYAFVKKELPALLPAKSPIPCAETVRQYFRRHLLSLQKTTIEEVGGIEISRSSDAIRVAKLPVVLPLPKEAEVPKLAVKRLKRKRAGAGHSKHEIVIHIPGGASVTFDVSDPTAFVLDLLAETGRRVPA